MWREKTIRSLIRNFCARPKNLHTPQMHNHPPALNRPPKTCKNGRFDPKSCLSLPRFLGLNLFWGTTAPRHYYLDRRSLFQKKKLPTPYGPGTIEQQSNDWSGCNDCSKNNTSHLLCFFFFLRLVAASWVLIWTDNFCILTRRAKNLKKKKAVEKTLCKTLLWEDGHWSHIARNPPKSTRFYQKKYGYYFGHSSHGFLIDCTGTS